MSDSNETNATLQDLLTEYDVGTGITRPLSERGKPMPDQSHLYIDCDVDNVAADYVVNADIQPTTPDLFVQEEVKVNAPTLGTSSTIVKFSRSIPSFVRKDKKGAARNDAATGAKRGTHRGSKKIINCPEHDALEQCGDDFYQYTAKATAAWDYGEPLLPMSRYNAFSTEEIRVMHPDTGIFYKELKPAFLAAYPAAVRQAQIDMGSAFDPSLYPSVQELERSIQMTVVYKPIGDKEDFRLDVPAQALDEMKSRYEKDRQRSMQTMADKLWVRLLKPLTNMSKMLDYDDKGKPRNGHFQGTLVSNVLEIVDLLKDCNFNNDPDMARVQRELRNALTGMTTDILKVSASARIKTKGEVDRIIKSLPTFGI